jgi:hypothetical protein
MRQGTWMPAAGVAAALVFSGSVLVGQQLQTPPDWRWRTDTPATLVAKEGSSADTWYFVAMPPGWHVTTGPGALLYHPERQAKGNFVLEAEIFLFPGQSQEEYGLFVADGNVAGEEPPSYLAFVARRDGQAAILARKSTIFAPVQNWQRHEAVLAGVADGTAKNLFRVEAGPKDVAFSINSKPIGTVPRAGLNLEGAFGLRFGKDMNAHISRLDMTYRLAPAR